jgi:hypothetical protein
MRALLIGLATLALSAGAASAQVVYPGYGYAPYGYGYQGYGYDYAATAPLYDYATPAYGYGAVAPATAGTTIVIVTPGAPPTQHHRWRPVIITTHPAIGVATGAGVPVGDAEDVRQIRSRFAGA